IPFAILVGLLLRRLSGFLAEVPGSRIRLLIGFGLVLIGAAVIEGAGNLVVPQGMNTRGHAPFVVVTSFEELFEMSGGSVLLWAALGFFRNHWSTRRIFAELRPLAADEAARLRTG